MLLRVLLLCSVVSGVAADNDNTELQASNKPIKIGCLFPLAGPGGLYGRDSVEAIRIAEEDLKRLYPSISQTFEVIIGDTRSKPLRAVQIARDFIESKKVDFLCGVVSSRIALAVTEIAKEKKVFFIGTDHASPRLVTEALHPYYFRVSNDTRQSMQAGAQYIRNNYAKYVGTNNAKNNNKNDKRDDRLKIAYIGPDYDYGYQSWSDLRAFLTQKAVKFDVVGEYWPKLFETNYNIYIHALSDNKPDIVINGQWGQDFINFIKQAKQLQFFDETTVMNFDAGGNYETFADLGDEMPLGLVLSARHHINWPLSAENRSFSERFKKRVGRYPSYAAQGAYSGIVSIAQAVSNAGGVTDKEKLRVSFENLSIKLPEDPDGFTSRMDPKSHQILQAQSIGKTIINKNYPPASVMLGDWFVYYPAKEWPATINP